MCILWPLAILFRWESLFLLIIIFCVCVFYTFHIMFISGISKKCHHIFPVFLFLQIYLMVIFFLKLHVTSKIDQWGRQPLLSGQISIYITNAVRSFAFSATSLNVIRSWYIFYTCIHTFCLWSDHLKQILLCKRGVTYEVWSICKPYRKRYGFHYKTLSSKPSMFCSLWFRIVNIVNL